MTEESLTEEQLRLWVATVRWRFAKTMPDDPHEYTLKRWADPDMFDRVVHHIREHGYRGEYGGATYTYLNLHGHKYWAMGNTPYGAPFLINRAKLS
jgi:hypothetical protein